MKLWVKVDKISETNVTKQINTLLYVISYLGYDVGEYRVFNNVFKVELYNLKVDTDIDNLTEQITNEFKNRYLCKT